MEYCTTNLDSSTHLKFEERWPAKQDYVFHQIGHASQSVRAKSIGEGPAIPIPEKIHEEIATARQLNSQKILLHFSPMSQLWLHVKFPTIENPSNLLPVITVPLTH